MSSSLYRKNLEKIVCMWEGKAGFDFLGMHYRHMITEIRWENRVKETYQYPNQKSNEKDEIKYNKRWVKSKCP